MKKEKFEQYLDLDVEGTGHSFYDIFRKEIEPTLNSIQDAIEIALVEKATKKGKLLTYYEFLMEQCLVRWRSSEKFRKEATEYVLSIAIRIRNNR